MKWGLMIKWLLYITKKSCEIFSLQHQKIPLIINTRPQIPSILNQGLLSSVQEILKDICTFHIILQFKTGLYGLTLTNISFFPSPMSPASYINFTSSNKRRENIRETCESSRGRRNLQEGRSRGRKLHHSFPLLQRTLAYLFPRLSSILLDS